MPIAFINSWWSSSKDNEGHRVVYVVHETAKRSIEVVLNYINSELIRYDTQLQCIHIALQRRDTIGALNEECKQLRRTHFNLQDSVAKLRYNVPVMSDAATQLLECLRTITETVNEIQLQHAAGNWAEISVRQSPKPDIPQLQLYSQANLEKHLHKQRIEAFIHVRSNILTTTYGRDKVEMSVPPHFVTEDQRYVNDTTSGMPWEEDSSHPSLPKIARATETSPRTRPKMAEGNKVEILRKRHLHTSPVSQIQAEPMKANLKQQFVQQVNEMPKSWAAAVAGSPDKATPASSNNYRMTEPPAAAPIEGHAEGEQIAETMDISAKSENQVIKFTKVCLTNKQSDLHDAQTPHRIVQSWKGPFPQCLFCGSESHWAVYCETAANMQYHHRLLKFKISRKTTKQVCQVCFQKHHDWYQCKSHHICTTCGSTAHNKLLHIPGPAVIIAKDHLEKLIARRKNRFVE